MSSAYNSGNGRGSSDRDARPRSEPLPRLVSGALILGAFAMLIWAEHRRPLRAERESKARRDVRNLAMAGLSALTLSMLEKPVVEPLARVVERRRIGLLQRVPLPRALEIPAAVLLMDYTLYLWHVLVHRVPALWRFHKVHHVDLDMDASTALRFHFGEMALSVPYRAAQVALLGVGPRALSIWQTFLFLSIMFHHSNVRLPPAIERHLVRVIVTPRMHEIHHSIVQEETDSNWSSGFTIWDWLHRSLRLDIPESDIDIGIPAYRTPDEVKLPRLVQMPFEQQRPSWQLPGGERPRRVVHRSQMAAFEPGVP